MCQCVGGGKDTVNAFFNRPTKTFTPHPTTTQTYTLKHAQTDWQPDPSPANEIQLQAQQLKFISRVQSHCWSVHVHVVQCVRLCGVGVGVGVGGGVGWGGGAAGG